MNTSTVAKRKVITNDDIHPKLYVFLKEKRIVGAFKRECNRPQSWYNQLDDRKDQVKKGEHSAVGCAFSWSDATEGFDFWQDINDAWNDIK
jgi:hypothetical protein